MAIKQLIIVFSAVLVGCASAKGILKESNGCPNNFVRSESGDCFHIFRDYLLGNSPPVTWQQARDICRGMVGSGWSADLAWSVDTDTLMEFNDYIVQHEPEMRDSYVYWVGALQATANGHWEWTNGKQVDPTSYIWLYNSPYARYSPAYGKLVPAGAYDRHYLLDESETDLAPSFVCQAAPLCA